MKSVRLSIFTRAFWIRFWDDLSDHALHAIIQVVALLLLYLILRVLLYRLIDGVTSRFLSRDTRIGEERIGRLQTLQGLFKSVVSYILFFVFGALLLQAVGLNILPFVTTASVLGVAIALGSQKLFRDVISGFFMLVDDLYIVGDVVKIGEITGTVQEVGMRVTRLLDANGRLHLLANGDIGTVTNLSRHPVQEYVEIGLAADADLNKVVQTVNAAGDTLFATDDDLLKAAPRVAGIVAFNATSLTVRVTVVANPHELQAAQMRVRAAIRDALRTASLPLAP